MVRIENDCVGPCPQGCLGSACPKRAVPYYYCDCCGESFDPDELYDYDGEMYCAECVLSQFSKISV